VAKTYEFPRPALTVDCAVFGFDLEKIELQVLLIQRSAPPFKGKWALPGGFVDVGETVETAARRELEEETGLILGSLEQLQTFSEPKRDPREHVVSVAHYALVSLIDQNAEAGSDAKRVGWFSVSELPALGFDHGKILSLAIARLQAEITRQPIGFALLPKKFTLTQLQELFETVLGRSFDKRNFRRKILSLEVLKNRGEIKKGPARRAAKLFSFDRKAGSRFQF
jgi:8-oxo-dGTP diphosphatase